jgi:hypothetical protein
MLGVWLLISGVLLFLFSSIGTDKIYAIIISLKIHTYVRHQIAARDWSVPEDKLD